MKHRIYTIKKDDKIGALRTLLDRRDDSAVIVFGKTKRGVKKLAAQLEDMGYPAGALQGNLSQNARERMMAAFRSGATPIMVATNVAARGLDIELLARSSTMTCRTLTSSSPTGSDGQAAWAAPARP